MISLITIIGLFIINAFFKAHAQDLEPRAYNNTPVSMNFLLVDYQYTDNDDLDNGKTRKQDPIHSALVNIIYSFANNAWASFGTIYYEGGRTSIDGVMRNDLQQNWRNGATVAIPVNRNHSLKLFAISGLSTRTGTVL